MMNKTFVYTSIFAALFMTLSLKFFQLFRFIKWSPIGWAKKWPPFDTFHYTMQWTLLFIAFLLIFGLIYIVMSFMDSIPPAITALLFTVVAVVMFEWIISEPKSPIEALRSISVPVFAITAIVLRFIAGTAVFMRKLSREV